MTEHILVTGVTGYVGGRLVPKLLEAGYRLRCLVRDPERLAGYPWLAQVEVRRGDALDPQSLRDAMQDIDAAYYLIHGRQGGQDSASRDLQAARNFALAAAQTGVKRILYLGELVDPTSKLSPYLRSRHETGHILRQQGVPVTEFRAGMIVGAGSALFEMIRYLVEHQQLLICPRWFYTLAQPIAMRDVLAYLVSALQVPESAGKLIEIGGASRLSYADMLTGYAQVRQLKRWRIPAPVYAPRLSAYWVHMVTPVHWRIILPLIEGLHAESLADEALARRLFPQVQPLDFPAAVQTALDLLQGDAVETSWRDALVTVVGDDRPLKLSVVQGMLIERRSLKLDLPPEAVFRAYLGLGGERGWLYLNWTWQVRGWFDKLVGGVGLRRGRRHPDELRPGEALDFWRVEAVEPGRSLRLRAEMKVPGLAWLELQSLPQPSGGTLLTQTAYFAPRGVAGLLYWYLLYPIHGFIFSGMIRKIGERAKALVSGQAG
jgi:uncharacterized protein YbjT (DUF2867 family)